MKKILILLIPLLLTCFCSVKGQKEEFDFANQLAKDGLWKEAHLRWLRAQAKGVNNAALHNNIAIALEIMGKSDEAEKEYQIATKMAPNDSHIKSNYDNFKRKPGKDDLEPNPDKKPDAKPKHIREGEGEQ